ncbi:MAG: DNA translocase FtsK 4TM domain-containing protein, partial [Chitinophagaceae bacterium]
MATKLKKKSKNSPEKKPAKSDMKAFRAEKEETIDWKSLARDERTWKIVGAVFLVIATFLFISFGSYLFTWKEDQAIAQQGFSALLDNDKPVANLLGRFGAVISHFFIFKAFGVASFLICTFFFVVGVNLLFRRRVFSIWKNLKYVTVGLLVLSVLLSFVFAKSDFAFGGGVGDMINRKLTGALGVFGTGAVLLLLAAAYFIWQFNPAFNLPDKKMQTDNEEGEEENDETETGVLPVSTGKTINDVYSDGKVQQGNAVTSDGPVVINFPDEKPLHDFKIIEKEEPPEENIEAQQPMVEKEIVSEILHQHEFDLPIEPVEEKIIPVKEYVSPKKKEEPIELEIKAVPDKIVAEEDAVTVVENLPPYEPTLDLRDYKYPTLTLLETHGSEKIIQDTNELENNKNQIIATLRNYAIEIQKISATVGPTVTLYEIVPAPGIRISKIKNLEDDIALSLAALGIRIIAP